MTTVPSPRRDSDSQPSLAQLRRQRHRVLDERARCDYLLRLVQAELDLLVAGTLRPHELDLSQLTGLATPTLRLTEGFFARCDADVAGRLRQLRDAQRELQEYAEVLAGVCDSATRDLIRALSPNPSACL